MTRLAKYFIDDKNLYPNIGLYYLPDTAYTILQNSISSDYLQREIIPQDIAERCVCKNTVLFCCFRRNIIENT